MAEAPEPPGPAAPLQFEKAEFGAGPGGGAACTNCRRPIGGTYYEANGKVVCEQCQSQMSTEGTQGSGAGPWLRATLFGVLAAAAGSALYYGVAALTNMEFGLIAIVVGLMVGGAVRLGSQRRGGWRYQALAMFLTYASIVSTYIPHIMKALREHHRQEQSTAGPSVPASASTPVSTTEARSTGVGQTLRGLLVALAILAAIAFAAPFLAGFENIMGMIIIGIGLYEAWKINRRVALVINGPFKVGAPPQPPLGG